MKFSFDILFLYNVIFSTNVLSLSECDETGILALKLQVELVEMIHSVNKISNYHIKIVTFKIVCKFTFLLN